MVLRVAHVLNSRGRGGVPHVANALIRRFDRNRIQPFLYYLKPGGGPDLMQDLDIPWGEGRGGKSGAMIGLLNWLAEQRIDVAHTHSYRPNIYGRMASAPLHPTGLRIVAHYHNDYSDKWQDPKILGAERSLAGVTDAAIAVSGAVATHVADHVPDLPAIHVVPNGIDPARLTGDRQDGRRALGLAEDEIAIGLVGRICHQKGIDTFVDAALLLASRHPAARFLVIGDVEDAALHERLVALVSAAGYASKIRFCGYREDVADVFAALDLLAAPSRWEGFGLVLAEAMWAGVPVVASAVGGIPSVVGNAARLIAPDRPELLAAALEELIANPSMRDSMVRDGHHRAGRFDWGRAADDVQTIYDRIMDPR